MTDIEQNLFAEFWRKLCEATDLGIARSNTPYITGDFYHELQYNNAVFAAFKTHRMGRDMSKLLLDSNGGLKPFEQWVRDVRPIADHQVYNWFKTEYNTAINRAHLTADWKQFEAEKDVLPNLEWMESTSVERRLTHTPFYGLVLPIEHEFWTKIKPGDEWGCKCGLAATDAERTPEDQIPPYSNYKPTKGLDNNPAHDAKLFNDTHPYFPSKCDGCVFNTNGNDRSKAQFFNQTKEDCYKKCLKARPEINKKIKSAVAMERHHYLDKMIRLLDIKIEKLVEGRTIKVQFSKKGNQHLYSDTFSRSKTLIKDDLDTLDEILKTSTFVKMSPNSKLRKDDYVRFYYFEAKLRGVTVYLNVGETEFISKQGNIVNKRYLYSITDVIK